MLAMDGCTLSNARIPLLSTVIKDVFDRKQKESLELTPNEIEQLVKQTLLHTNKDEMWVRHLSDARKHCQGGACKASAKRKETSKGSKSSKGIVDCTDSWCICGMPECRDMNACECKDCPIDSGFIFNVWG